MACIYADIVSERLRRKSDLRNTVKMSQDIIADTLNQIMNALKARKSTVKVKRHSQFLLEVLAIGKIKGYIKNYSVDKGELVIDIGHMTKCQAVKPRYMIQAKDIQKYVQRYLPARGMGVLVISTSKGLMTHQTAEEKKVGGSVIAYFY